MPDPKHISSYTYDDYLQWEGDWELIGGNRVLIEPSAANPHQNLLIELIYDIVGQIKSQGKWDQIKVTTDLDWKINAETVVRPDLMIIAGRITTKYLEFPPVLIIEILSKSTAMRDRNVKFDLYSKNGVSYYVLIDPEQKTLETYRLIGGKYVEVTGKQIEVEKDCRVEITRRKIFGR